MNGMTFAGSNARRDLLGSALSVIIGGTEDTLSQIVSSVLAPTSPHSSSATVSATLTHTSSQSSTTKSASSSASHVVTSTGASGLTSSVSSTHSSTPSSTISASSTAAASSAATQSVTAAPSSTATNSFDSTISNAASIPTPTSSDISVAAAGSSSSSAVSSNSAAAISASATSATTQSFLQNKALSVGVITSVSLIGLVLLIVIATFAIRKRKRDRLHKYAANMSEEGLVSNVVDVEKGSTGGADRLTTVNSLNGATPPVRTWGSQEYAYTGGNRSLNGMDPYNQLGYPARPAYAPPQGYPQDYGSQNPSFAQQGYMQPSYSAYKPNQQESPYASKILPPAPLRVYDPAVPAPYNATYTPQGPPPSRRPSASRKTPPPLSLDTNPIIPAGPSTPMQFFGVPLSAVGSSDHRTRSHNLNMPASSNGSSRRRSSLLDSPASSTNHSKNGRSSQSHEIGSVGSLEMLPQPAQLPDEFGAAKPQHMPEDSAQRDAVKTTYQLTVRNE